LEVKIILKYYKLTSWLIVLVPKITFKKLNNILSTLYLAEKFTKCCNTEDILKTTYLNRINGNKFRANGIKLLIGKFLFI